MDEVDRGSTVKGVRSVEDLRGELGGGDTIAVTVALTLDEIRDRGVDQASLWNNILLVCFMFNTIWSLGLCDFFVKTSYQTFVVF
mmetsp:Transcript_4278/g.8289  ORF Transcript_4278/g.8289 Transcript_4278/m.8289 type:complete len:85 (+) Transcript_4278:825-1079(+)